MDRDAIYDKVMTALQEAEEMGGPEGNEYIGLMNDIITECSERITNVI